MPKTTRPIKTKKIPSLAESLKQLNIYAWKNGLRFGQALWTVLDLQFTDLFFIVDTQLSEQIQFYLNAQTKKTKRKTT